MSFWKNTILGLKEEEAPEKEESIKQCKSCHQCGESVSVSGKYCGQCGTKLPQPTNKENTNSDKTQHTAQQSTQRQSFTYQEFLAGYNSGKFTVLVDRSKAGDFVMSEFADRHNKPAHLFWTWLGILLVFPLSVIIGILYGWIFALISFISGLIISNAARKSAGQFVLENMLGDEDFWDYVLLHRGVKIVDKDGNSIYSKFLHRSQTRPLNNQRK